LSNSRWVSGGGAIQGRHAFMFIADVALGNPYVAAEAHGYTKPPNGHHCVFGKAGVSRSWGGTLMNNEFVTYDRRQNRLRYLVEFNLT